MREGHRSENNAKRQIKDSLFEKYPEHDSGISDDSSNSSEFNSHDTKVGAELCNDLDNFISFIIDNKIELDHLDSRVEELLSEFTDYDIRKSSHNDAPVSNLGANTKANASSCDLVDSKTEVNLHFISDFEILMEYIKNDSLKLGIEFYFEDIPCVEE